MLTHGAPRSASTTSRLVRDRASVAMFSRLISVADRLESRPHSLHHGASGAAQASPAVRARQARHGSARAGSLLFSSALHQRRDRQNPGRRYRGRGSSGERRSSSLPWDDDRGGGSGTLSKAMGRGPSSSPSTWTQVWSSPRTRTRRAFRYVTPGRLRCLPATTRECGGRSGGGPGQSNRQTSSWSLSIARPRGEPETAAVVRRIRDHRGTWRCALRLRGRRRTIAAARRTGDAAGPTSQ